MEYPFLDSHVLIFIISNISFPQITVFTVTKHEDIETKIEEVVKGKISLHNHVLSNVFLFLR